MRRGGRCCEGMSGHLPGAASMVAQLDSAFPPSEPGPAGAAAGPVHAIAAVQSEFCSSSATGGTWWAFCGLWTVTVRNRRTAAPEYDEARTDWRLGLGKANFVLEEAHERHYAGSKYGDVYIGLYVVRGENVALVGELVRGERHVGLRCGPRRHPSPARPRRTRWRTLRVQGGWRRCLRTRFWRKRPRRRAGKRPRPSPVPGTSRAPRSRRGVVARRGDRALGCGAAGREAYSRRLAEPTPRPPTPES